MDTKYFIINVSNLDYYGFDIDVNDISNFIFVTGTRGRCQSFVLLCGGVGVGGSGEVLSGSTSIVQMKNSCHDWYQDQLDQTIICSKCYDTSLVLLDNVWTKKAWM